MNLILAVTGAILPIIWIINSIFIIFGPNSRRQCDAIGYNGIPFRSTIGNERSGALFLFVGLILFTESLCIDGKWFGIIAMAISTLLGITLLSIIAFPKANTSSPTNEETTSIFPPWHNAYPEIQTAITNETDIEFDYIDNNGACTHRRVSPFGIRGSASSPYLIGYCHLRKSRRTFSLRKTANIKPV